MYEDCYQAMRIQGAAIRAYVATQLTQVIALLEAGEAERATQELRTMHSLYDAGESFHSEMTDDMRLQLHGNHSAPSPLAGYTVTDNGDGTYTHTLKAPEDEE